MILSPLALARGLSFKCLFMNNYKKFLFKTIKISCPAVIITALIFSVLLYPPFAFLTPVGELNTAEAVKLLSVSVFVLSLCRYVLTHIENDLDKSTKKELAVTSAAMLPAFFLRNFGGFSLNGYVFAFFASLSLPFAFFELTKKNLLKNKRVSAISFELLYYFSLALLIGIGVLSAVRSQLNTMIVMRLSSYPLFLILSFTVCLGKEIKKLGNGSYALGRILFIPHFVYIFASAVDFENSEKLFLLLPSFSLICISFLIADRVFARKRLS